jgi:hypothetical protein
MKIFTFQVLISRIWSTPKTQISNPQICEIFYIDRSHHSKGKIRKQISRKTVKRLCLLQQTRLSCFFGLAHRKKSEPGPKCKDDISLLSILYTFSFYNTYLLTFFTLWLIQQVSSYWGLKQYNVMFFVTCSTPKFLLFSITKQHVF